MKSRSISPGVPGAAEDLTRVANKTCLRRPYNRRICWHAGIKRCETSTAAAFSGLMPLTALALSCLLLGEQPAIRQWLGGILVITGMLVVGAQPVDPD